MVLRQAMLVTVDAVRQVVVVGAGTMGAGIAQVAAVAGWTATLVDVDAGRLDAAVGRIQKSLAGGVARGKLTAAAADDALARVGTAGALSACAAADVVVEAVPESLELKRQVLAAIDAAAPGPALLASNTSSLSIGAIAAATRRPGRVVGMHFFNPVPAMKLVEIVRHDGTEEAAVELARAVTQRLGKQPIVVRDVPGFASSRLGVLLGLEAARMLEAGVASAVDIDTAMRLGYGHPMGPLELGDLVGLDVRLAIAEHLARELGPRFEPPALLRRLVAEGKLGQKTGEGFHRWREGKVMP
jgi:3-hydroxybutyryl-CoA dehydrogenase